MNLLYAIRYFQVVAVVPSLFVAGFVITVIAAAIRLSANPSAIIDSLTPVLFLQLFSASSGYRLPARRGYYDLLLTMGIARWQIGLAHCVVSIAPGIVSWVCIGLLEAATGHGTPIVSARIGTCVAFLGGSLIAWAAALSLSRATAAVGWLLVMTIPPVAHFVSPVQLLGVEATGRWLLPLGLTVCTAALAGCHAFRHVMRAPIPL